MNSKLFFVMLLVVALAIAALFYDRTHAQEEPQTEEDIACLSFSVNGASYEWTDNEKVAPMYRYVSTTNTYNEKVGWYYQKQCGTTVFSAVILDSGYITTLESISNSHWLAVNNAMVLNNDERLARAGTEFTFFTIGARKGWEGSWPSLIGGGYIVAVSTYQVPLGPVREARTYSVPTASRLVSFGAAQTSDILSSIFELVFFVIGLYVLIHLIKREFMR